MSETQLPPLGEVIKKIRELAEENSNFVYQMPDSGACQYTFNGQGSCIVGQAYLELGVPIAKVESWDTGCYGDPLGADQVVEQEYEDYSLTDKNWINSIQNYQDSDKPWGLAVQETDRDLGIDTP